MKHSEVVIAGAGPAGMAAAVRAREGGKGVTVLDDNPSEGGQIWRGARQHAGAGAQWIRRFQTSGAELVPGACIVGGDAARRMLLVEHGDEVFEIGYESLIIATGARELLLPFPGWTLPNAMGAGGLQSLVKSGLPVQGKKIVVAGSGPLLLAVAAYLQQRGAIVAAIAEQADWSRLLRFAMRLMGSPAKLWQAATLTTGAYWADCWVTAAEGDKKVERVHLRRGSGVRTIDCDYLAVGYGLWPNAELARHLDCAQRENAVEVNDLQQTSVPGIYCAGEAAGIGGVDGALIEGEIAGFAAAGMESRARSLFPARSKTRAFAKALEEAFALRSEIRELGEPETIVCRCEDVTLERLRTADSWRAAKLHLRCGMGPCQGRVCGPAAQVLFGWQVESIRLPILPARVGSLISETISSERGIAI